MAYSDLREWIKTLEKEGELTRVKAEVNWDLRGWRNCARKHRLDRGLIGRQNSGFFIQAHAAFNETY